MSTDENKPEAPKTSSKRLKGAGNGVLTDRLWIAARSMYEGDLRITHAQVAKEFGVSPSVIERRGSLEGWKKNTHTHAAMTEKAHKLADSTGVKIDETGPELTADKADEVRQAITEEAAVDARAAVLSRHRAEWAAPRKLSYEAVQSRDFDRAKLAKITAETLQIIQTGERKAWGLDAGGEGNGVTVVIDRG